MKLNFCIGIYALLFSLSVTNGYIIERNTIASVLEFLPHADHHHGTLVIFDIDYTLARPREDLTVDFYHLLQLYVNRGLSHEDARAYALPFNLSLQEKTSLELIEPSVLELIEQLRQSGVWVIALTARGPYLTIRTIEQLREINLDFSQSAFFYNCIRQVYQSHEGIIFCNGGDKGKILIDVFKTNNVVPHTIIFVDDIEKNLQMVAKMAHEHHINFFGIRYSRCDERIKPFDALETEQLLEHVCNHYCITLPQIPESLFQSPTPAA